MFIAKCVWHDACFCFVRCSKNFIHGTFCAISIIDFSTHFWVLNISHKYTIIGHAPIFIRIKCMLVFGLNQFEYDNIIIFYRFSMIIYECITFETSQSYIFTLMNVKSTVLNLLLFLQACEIIKSSLFFIIIHLIRYTQELMIVIMDMYHITK